MSPASADLLLARDPLVDWPLQQRRWHRAAAQHCVVEAKSGFDPDGIDLKGQVRRRAELRALVEAHARLQSELGPLVPVVVAGDFNGNASR